MDRFKAYKFFSHLFSYPRGETFFENLKKFYPFEDRSPLEALLSVDRNELAADYTSLFEVRPGGAPCKPYQSVFEGGVLMGAAATDAAKFYSLFDLSVPEGELPDRVNLLFDFAAFLVKLLEETPPEGRARVFSIYKGFFERHLLWTLRLADCLEQNAPKYLAAFAPLLREFLSGEAAALGVKLSQV